MNELSHPIRDALRYWESRRILYNALLATVALLWVILTWPHFRSVQLLGIPPGERYPVLLIPMILAFLANVCYCAAYLVEIPFHRSYIAWPRYRWAVLLAGTVFAILLENYWIADEIYPFVPR